MGKGDHSAAIVRWDLAARCIPLPTKKVIRVLKWFFFWVKKPRKTFIKNVKFQGRNKKTPPASADGVLNKNPASSYSPTQLPVQYHRR